MEAKLRFSLADPSGQVKSMGEANANLGAEELVLVPSAGAPLSIALRDVVSIEEMEYRILVQLRPSGSLMLFNAGLKHEDLVRSLYRSVNELEMKDMLMDERLLKQGVPGEAELIGPAGTKHIGKCETRLYETALIVMPERGGLVRCRYGEVGSVAVEDYRLLVSMESGERLRLSKLGRETDPLRRGIMDGASAITSAAVEMVREAFPGADPSGALRAAQLLKDGRTAQRREVEQACPGLWAALEGRLSTYGIGDELGHLSSASGTDVLRIGMKRPLHAKEEPDYIFFLVPIYSPDRSKGGNALAFEASSSEEQGRATYFFRIWGRDEYKGMASENMMEQADDFSRRVAKGLEAVNFRREPIYLPEADLFTPERTRYRYAIMRIPELRLLRERFIGRVVHSSPEQWRQDVASLLSFNVAQKDDLAVWRRSGEAQGP